MSSWRVGNFGRGCNIVHFQMQYIAFLTNAEVVRRRIVFLFLGLRLCGRLGGVWFRIYCGKRMALSVQFSPSGVYTFFIFTCPCETSLFNFRACVMTTMVLVYLVRVSKSPRFLLGFVARKEFLGSQVESHRRYFYSKRKCLLVC